MALTPGTKIGPYEIGSPLGEGGMGIVFRARDSSLQRDVAIKALPDVFAGDTERLSRFQREAQALAALNHPNIAQIYGLTESNGSKCIVMELVAGEGLDLRLKRGAIPLDEAIPIAMQIAQALEAAHEAGFIHRDLKPGNVMLTADSKVKVLDFGLAKELEGAARASGLSNSPTMSLAATQSGVILGTAAYMSPEQARGRPVDRSTDLWAFGCVMYEMLTGKPPFEGETVTDILGRIVAVDPDWTALPEGTSPAVRRLIRRCLEKNHKQRLRDAGDAQIELRDTSSDSAMDAAAPKAQSWSLTWIAAVLVASLITGLAVWRLSRVDPPTAPVVRFQIPAPDKTILSGPPVISPNGRLIAFPARDEQGRVLLWLRSLDSLEARALPGVENPASPVLWSPDSRFIAFASEGKLKRIDVSGGAAQVLTDVPLWGSGDWNRQGVIIFAAGALGSSGLWRVPDSGGTAEILTKPEAGGETHRTPFFLPDGRRFIYVRTFLNSGTKLYLGSLDIKQDAHKELKITANYLAAYTPSADGKTGDLLFVRNTTLFSQHFDLDRLETSGEAIAIAENLPTGPRPFSVSTTGALALREAVTGANSQLVWRDRQGKQLGLLGQPGLYSDLALSPDGKFAVVDGDRPSHILVADLTRGVLSRITPGNVAAVAPIVSPDNRVAFMYGGNSRSGGDIYLAPANGASEPEPLVKSPNTKHPNNWSLDGRYLIYDDHHPTQRQDLWIVPMSGDRKPIPFLTTAADETDAAFSPDGKWIAYSSDESGQREVWVRDFVPDRSPATGTVRVQISAAGGAKPKWRRDGKELYYIAGGRKFMAVPIKVGSTFEAGIATPLFEATTVGYTPYDVTADGTRFLVNTAIDTQGASLPITVILNWQSMLKK